MTYTPRRLADFVASKLVRAAGPRGGDAPLRVLDPAVGEGELLVRLVGRLRAAGLEAIEVCGYDTDAEALVRAEARLRAAVPGIKVEFAHRNFLDVAAGLEERDGFDLVIANPPYVRTQILGAARAREIARRFGLNGRVDIYYAFVLGIGSVLKPDGVAGLIVSNRFLSTRSGESVRRSLRTRFEVLHLWDFGDTRLFGAAVLPAVLLLGKPQTTPSGTAGFTSIYETDEPAEQRAACPIEAVERPGGVVAIGDGRRFAVVHGSLSPSTDPGAVWRVATASSDRWLATVEKHRWGTFRDIGRVRVGVKTCADRVFIRDDWSTLGAGAVPELLRPLTTHHIGRRFRAAPLERPRQILYPHEVEGGVRRAVDLAHCPASRSYLERNRAVLERRSYVLQAGRKWYELWVPHDPAAWDRPKLVFRDIAEEPTFWIDPGGSVINGDCYWLLAEDPSGPADLLWLAAAVGNSRFITRFYDQKFPNKLYSGRRRFITQYVEQFPLPDPTSPLGLEIIAMAKRLHDSTGTASPDAPADTARLEAQVCEAFGLAADDF